MPNACVAPYCKTGYRSSRDHYSVFFAPKDSAQRAKWQAAIPRVGFELKERHVLCEKHFAPDQIIRENVIKDVHGKVLMALKLKNCRLVKGAVPSLFPGGSPTSSQDMQLPGNSEVDEENGRKIFFSSNDQNGMDDIIGSVGSDADEPVTVPFSMPHSPENHLSDPSVFELLLVDQHILSLPITWARNIPLFGPRVIIYMQLITREVGNIIRPVFFKEVCIQESGCVTCSVFGCQLKKEHFMMPQGPLQSCEQLNDLLLRLDSLQICEGINVKGDVNLEHQMCVHDSLGKWRHKNCFMVPKKDDTCSMCSLIVSSWKNKKLKHKRLCKGNGPISYLAMKEVNERNHK